MPEQKITPESFPQHEVEKLGKAIEQIKEKPEFKGASKEKIVSEALKTLASSAPPVSKPKKEEEKEYLPDYMEEDPVDRKNEVEALLKLTIKEGFSAGIKESKKHSAYIEDAFHDALRDKVVPELEKKGMI